MAQVPYEGGVPQVAPDARPPDDYDRVQSSPADFGAAIGTGLSNLGAAGTKVGAFFGQVQTDDAINTAMSSANNKLNSFLSLRGGDALSAQQSTQDALDSIFKENRQNLGTLEQQHQYDQAVRSFQERYVSGKMSTHADQQAKDYATTTNNSSLKVALDLVSSSANDPTVVENARHDAISAAVKQTQIEGNGGNPVAVKAATARAEQAVYKTQIETLAVSDPLKAQGVLEKNRATLGEAYYPLADQLKTRVDKATGESVADQVVQQTAGRPSARNGVGATTPTQATDDPAALLRHFEGYQSTPYWDVNHWRVGYGSDTVTRADGSIEPVTAMTQVTKDDAERDLQRRTAQSTAQAQTAIGADGWAKLPGPARASITSATYNYGHTPDSVVAAARTGDPAAVAGAINALGGANGGVNEKRRAAEAGNAAGFGLGGFQAGGGKQYALPAVAANAGAPGAPAAQAIDPAAAPEITPPPPADPSLPPPLPAPVPPQDMAAPGATEAAQPLAPMTAEEHEAAALAAIQQRADLTPTQRDYALAKVKQNFLTQQMIDQQSKAARASRVASTQDNYVKEILTGAKPDIFSRIANDPAFNESPTAREHLWELAKKQSGEQDTTSYGPKFTDTLNRVLLPPGDPNRVFDSTQLYAMAAHGDLTLPGAEKLKSIVDQTKKSVNGAGLTVRQSTALKTAHSYLSFEQDLGSIKIADPVGEKLYNDFVNQFYSAYDKWANEGKDPAEFKLFQTDEIKKTTQALRSSSKMAQDRLNAVAQSAGGAPANEPAPPAPVNTDPTGWQTLMAQPPMTAKGVPMSRPAFANVIAMLANDPSSANVKAFNESRYGRDAGLNGEKILQQLGIKPGAAEPPDGAAQPPAPETTLPATPVSARETEAAPPAAAAQPSAALAGDDRLSDTAPYYGGPIQKQSAEATAAYDKRVAEEANTKQEAQRLVGGERMSALRAAGESREAVEAERDRRQQAEVHARAVAALEEEQRTAERNLAEAKARGERGERTQAQQTRYEAALKDIADRRKKLERP